MTHPNSLCSRVLKGRYFPNSDFLHGTTPNRCSATWIGIMAEKEALQEELIKRIGDGSSISVCHDCWIPGIQSMKPSTHLGNEDEREIISLVHL
jgi:hypothetical protein